MDARLDPAGFAGLFEGDTPVIRNAGGRASDSAAGRSITWLTITDPEQAVIDDVLRIRNHPLVAPEIPSYGYIYDVKSGHLVEVTKATEAGRPRLGLTGARS
jgi:carbonic anhydrase